MSITVHKLIQAFRSFLFSDFNHRAQNTNTNLTGICSFLFIQACLQANTNTNLTGILFLSFYPSLPPSKHKYKVNRHFVPSFSSQACLKANNNHSKHRANQSKANKNKHTSRSSLAEEEVAQQGSPPRRESVPDLCACLQDQTCQRQQRHQRRRDGSHQERV